MLIKNAEVDGRLADVRLTGDSITEIGQNLAHAGHVMNAGGNALIPGLHDHHLHLNATVAAMNSVCCGPPKVKTEHELIKALGVSGSNWLRGVSYHESVAGDIDREWLDANGPDRPVRIQHRSGRLWILNSLASEQIRMHIPKDGRIFDGDRKLQIALKSSYPDLTPLVNKLVSWGITGITEVTPNNGIIDFQHYLKHAQPLRLSIMGKPELAKLNTQDVGPIKFHYHEDHLPPLEKLTREFATAYETGRSIAAHCVTRAELMLVLAALEAAGGMPGDRIEHAAIADDMLIDWMKRLGVTIVTQPNFFSERADAYRADISEEDRPYLWRLRSFLDAGLQLATGSDAPFGNPNPWKCMHAAVNRPGGFRQNEEITPEQALALYTKPSHNAGGSPRRIAVGADADICLLDQPWHSARQNLTAVKVKASWITGTLVYSA